MKTEEDWKKRLAVLLKGTDFTLWYGNEWDLSDEIIEIVEREKRKSYKKGRQYQQKLDIDLYGTAVDKIFEKDLSKLVKK